ncbi:TnsD family Tn7-like transposition protein [Paraburkholderia terrae]|uniref:TnsD family Tn7-like transposition protein n=1 Tax=Paraburkholderia terrae TaxID=311230 RepID=UPI0037CC2031
MAIALFPLLDGETIGSNLGRYADFIGLQTTLPLRRRLFGYACKPETRLPSGLDHLAEEARDYWALDAEAIISDHTDFHYATLTVSEVQREAMRSAMLCQPAGRCSRRSASGWSGERVTRFRYCEDCLLEWRARGIPAYWMVDHQLPGVYVCCIHSRVLKTTNPAFSETLTDPTLMALKRSTDEDILTRVSFSESSAIEDIAKRSAQYRKANSSLTPATTMRELLRDAGFVWPDGSMENRAVVACVLEYFGREYCWLAGLDWQRMSIWLRNIADQERGRDASHPFMFIAAESLLNRRCASPGSFVPAAQNTVVAPDAESLDSDGIAVDKSMGELLCVGILHRKNDTWKECSREGAGWKLACSCGVSYRASDVSVSEKAKLTVAAYGARYQNLIFIGHVNGVSARTASQRPYTVNARFFRWARYAGFRKDGNLSREAIQPMRDRWCSLVENAQTERRITSAHRIDSKLYRTLCRYDRDWFVAFNLANRTRPKRSSLSREGSKIREPCGGGVDATLR